MENTAALRFNLLRDVVVSPADALACVSGALFPGTVQLIEKCFESECSLLTGRKKGCFVVGNICLFVVLFCFLFPGSSGGICEKSKLYSDGKKKSLNTGIITVQNYASHVPPKVSHITFAHEVGHNFGSPVSLLGVSGECNNPRGLLLGFKKMILSPPLPPSMTLDPSAHQGNPKAKT